MAITQCNPAPTVGHPGTDGDVCHRFWGEHLRRAPLLVVPTFRHGFRALVRLSRGAGLPPPWPDVLGLALRVRSPGGDPWDLLLSTTLGRRLPWPRRAADRGVPSSIAAFRAPAGPLLVGARLRGGRFLLAVAAPRGPWRPFAELVLHERVDVEVTFDPVLNPPTGLVVPGRWRRLREPASAGSRAGRST